MCSFSKNRQWRNKDSLVNVDVSSLLHSIRRAQLEIDQLKACVGGQRDATVDLTDVVKAVDRRLSAVETDRAVV